MRLAWHPPRQMKRILAMFAGASILMFAMGLFKTDAAAPGLSAPIEYKVVSGSVWNGDLQKALNEAGASGWHVQFFNTVLDSGRPSSVAIMTRQ
jgi:hypothetical protein